MPTDMARDEAAGRKQVMVRMDVALRQRLRIDAAANGRSISSHVCLILNDAIPPYEELISASAAS